MQFFKHPAFYVVVILDLIGLFVFGLDTWANVIQNVSIIGMAYGFWYFYTQHDRELRNEISHLKQSLLHLHLKHDKLAERHAALHEKVDRQNDR
ncbi:hypothetical protein N007_05000 [Alicyclobacillus acidoterrestris ATCC 49025]|nr:hypothetical protein N007_05000 [Alicyclobacillus acidoterrestris ATCC 49025]